MTDRVLHEIRTTRSHTSFEKNDVGRKCQALTRLRVALHFIQSGPLPP